MVMRKLLVLFLCFYSSWTYGQGCCSGGSGSPIAGGVSQGVLLEHQMELSSSFQYINSNRYLSGDKDTAHLYQLKNEYLYFRAAYGVTKALTISVESGYYANKTQVNLSNQEKVFSSGIADLIIFPRYDIYNEATETKTVEFTLGLGWKIPLGKYNDSFVTFKDPQTGKQFYTTSPPNVQPTTGSNDLILYGFGFRGFPEKNFRLFANAMYIRKGWNAMGEKFGDYASLGIFAGKTLFESLAITGQIKAEWTGKMQLVNKGEIADLLQAYNNVSINSTGGRKLLFVPQVSYTLQRKLTGYVLYELPLYQYLNGQQIGSQHLLTFGLNYRFFIEREKEKQ